MPPLPRFLNGYFFSSRSVKMTIPDETIFIENNNEFDQIGGQQEREEKKNKFSNSKKWSSLVCLKIISSPAFKQAIEHHCHKQTANKKYHKQYAKYVLGVVSRQKIDLILIEEISKKSVANYTQWEQSRYKVAFEQFKRFRKMD